MAFNLLTEIIRPPDTFRGVSFDRRVPKRRLQPRLLQRLARQANAQRANTSAYFRENTDFQIDNVGNIRTKHGGGSFMGSLVQIGIRSGVFVNVEKTHLSTKHFTTKRPRFLLLNLGMSKSLKSVILNRLSNM